MGDVLHTVTRGVGPRLVLVHGFTQTAACWGPIDDDLATDHELVLVDAPGHGGSASIQADLPTAADLLTDVGGRGTYVGYSMGGRLCLHAALSRPDAVERLVLISATAGIDDDGERAARRADDEQLARRIGEVGVAAFVDEWLAQALLADLTPAAAHRDARLMNTAAGLASSLRLAGTGSQQPLWSRLPALAMPVLVVVGERDAKFIDLGHRLSEAIGDNASVVVIPGAHHTAHLEQPDAFVAALRGWCRSSSR
jgi:2-succinyl-6-hydroxy-2,4-cyclohexadiene-1-carboxylate synthase